YSRSSLALLFSLARHHRYLPSFPTRRSSDLDIKSTFATEVIGDSLEIHSRRFGERAGGGSLVAPAAENIDCRQKQFSAGGVLAIGFWSFAFGGYGLWWSIRRVHFSTAYWGSDIPILDSNPIQSIE